MDPIRICCKTSLCYSCTRRLGTIGGYCSRCKEARYCSTDCQRAHFKVHSPHCRVIAEERKYLDYNVKNFAELVQYKQQRGLLWQLMLGRKLTPAECQMFMFSRVCAVCFKRENLFCCSICLSEYYCCDDHQQEHHESHKHFCQDLKLSLDMQCFLLDNHPVNVLKVKSIDSELSFEPNSLDSVLESTVPISDLNYLYSCDQILSGLTILFALEQCGFLVNRKFTQSHIQIHLVGATEFECNLNWCLITEIFFHWMTNLREIQIIFIGPELTQITQPFAYFTNQFCDDCKNNRKPVVKNPGVHKNFYHKVTDQLGKPDIVVAFNSGIHEFHESDKDTWQESLTSLVANINAPLVLTAYTEEEIAKDLEIIKAVANLDVIFTPKKNPFSNRSPLQDWATENVPIYFINNFLTIVKRE